MESQSERIYRLSRGWLGFTLLAGSTFLGLGMFLGWSAWTGSGNLAGSIGLRLFFYAFALMFGSAGIASFLYIFQFRVVLFGDQIRVRQLFRYREIRRRNVRGCRFPPNFTMILVPKDKAHRRVDVPLFFERDDAFYDWIGDLPILDIEDRIAAEEKILTDEKLGTNEDRRCRRLQEAHRAAKYASRFAVVVSAWALVYPKPYELAIFFVMIAPWTGIEVMRRYRGLVRIDGATNDLYPNIAMTQLAPGGLLLFRAFLDFQIVYWTRAALTGSLVAAAVVAILMWLDPKEARRFVNAAYFFMLLLPYGYGAGVFTNCLLRDQHVELVEARVISKHSSSNRHTLNLAPWGPQTEGGEVFASSSLYDNTQVGDSVCLAVHPGALGMRWFTVHACH